MSSLNPVQYDSKNKLGQAQGHLVSKLNNENAKYDKTIGIIVIQEWWGVNEQIKKQTEWFAEQLSKNFANVHAITPDLYRGKLAKDQETAGHLMSGLDWDGAVLDIEATARFLRENHNCHAVACTGFCMGGALTLAAMARSGDVVSVGSAFYGIPSADLADLTKITGPVQAHFGDKDQSKGFSDPEAVNTLEEKWKTAGVKYELYRYDADHAFTNEQRPEVYNEEAAKLSLDRTLEFFTKHMQ